ncbi:MAG: TorD/DmsD family molecular chaperone [Acidimicrobiales bacterium]
MIGTVTRPELARTLAASVRSPLDDGACRLLGLPAPPGAAEHTRVFVLETHPYASVHLGEEGMIGGDAGDRVAGFWRALGMVPPAEADHLGALLDLYARLGDEELALSHNDRRQAAVASARAALLWEHLAPWVPVYLATVDRLGDGFHAAWASLAAGVLSAEADALAPRAELPTALAVAPPPLAVTSRRELLDAVLAPVRSGVVITQADLSRAGRDLGLGVRRGERRFALEGLLDQDPAAVLAWLAALAAEWSSLHRRWHCGALEPVGRWWAARARASAAALDDAAAA